MTYFLTSLPTEVREVVIHRLSLGIVRHSDEHQSCFFVPIHSVGHVFDYLYAATSMRRFPAALPTTPSLDANNLLGIPRRCYLREFLPPFFSVIGSQSYGRTFRHRLTRRAFSCRVERFFRPKRVHRSCIFSSHPLLSRVVEKTYFFSSPSAAREIAIFHLLRPSAPRRSASLVSFYGGDRYFISTQLDGVPFFRYQYSRRVSCTILDLSRVFFSTENFSGPVSSS